MKKTKTIRSFAAALSALTALTAFSACRIDVDGGKTQRRERTPRSEYAQDYNYDFYSRGLSN